DSTEGSRASSPSRRSAGGQDEQPWLVNNSMTARGSAPAGNPPIAKNATAARMPGCKARRFIFGSPSSRAVPAGEDKGIVTGAITRHSIRGESQRSRRSRRREVAQHVLQDAPVLEVIQVLEGNDAAETRHT